MYQRALQRREAQRTSRSYPQRHSKLLQEFTVATMLGKVLVDEVRATFQRNITHCVLGISGGW